jgi:hypothetical protein
MERIATERVDFLFLVLAVLLAVLSSCHTIRELPAEKVKPLKSEKLLRRVEQNTLNYNVLSINRIFCNFSDSETNSNFKVNLKAERNKKILLSISKMNIPVGQVLLTPDSLLYVNYIERNYLVADYAFLSRLFNINVDFHTVQSILSNDVFLYARETENNNFSKFDSSVEEGMYVLEFDYRDNIFDEKKDKIMSLKSSGEMNKVYRKMYFNPENFTLMKLISYDTDTGRELSMVFDDFVKVKKNNFPGFVDVKVISENEELRLKIRMNGFSTEIIDSIDLQIPDKYDQIYIN